MTVPGCVCIAREAAKLNALANGFKLSDYGLVPIQKKETVRKGNSYQNVEVRGTLI